MGQTLTKSTITKPWADGPIPLIESPRKRLRAKAGEHKSESGAVTAASTMAIVHNAVIRGLNCIYLQASNVKLEQDIADFTQYILCWSALLRNHHEQEEELYFPWLEEDIGIEGYMGKNVEQHHAFEAGIKGFEAYNNAVRAGTEEYSAAKVRSHIDGFGSTLTEHLRDEIPFFEELEKFGEKINWSRWEKRVSDHAVANSDKAGELAFLMTNHDMTYESPVHDPVWPPFPWFVGVILRLFYVPKYKGAWRFSCSDAHGQPKELEFA